ncbi:hypothetical protein CNMCM5793_002292 [Aspergillus hiratsukae]|uniref:Uncharacterized protein n=1 Tax=Aspergillus hiratsukae TaxID=1194566 RepID=A0A8H6PCJ5_9EURO|nr:hypothetical protein CNMCM5793_002292 [Aspergillus hiratsukae]
MGVPSTYAAALKANTTQTKPVPLRDLREIRVQRANLTPEEARKPSDAVLRDQVCQPGDWKNTGRAPDAKRRPSPAGGLVGHKDQSGSEEGRVAGGSKHKGGAQTEKIHSTGSRRECRGLR